MVYSKTKYILDNFAYNARLLSIGLSSVYIVHIHIVYLFHGEILLLSLQLDEFLATVI